MLACANTIRRARGALPTRYVDRFGDHLLDDRVAWISQRDYCAVVAVGIAYLLKKEERETQERQQQVALQTMREATAIREDQKALTDLKLAKEQFGNWVLSGTISNNSAFDLASLRFLVTMTDCVSEKQCRTIGQETADIRNDDGWKHRPIVPAGQVRAFMTYSMGFKNMPATNDMRWEAKVVEIRAAFE